eukprot:g60415.t1
MTSPKATKAPPAQARAKVKVSRLHSPHNETARTKIQAIHSTEDHRNSGIKYATPNTPGIEHQSNERKQVQDATRKQRSADRHGHRVPKQRKNKKQKKYKVWNSWALRVG